MVKNLDSRLEVSDVEKVGEQDLLKEDVGIGKRILGVLKRFNDESNDGEVGVWRKMDALMASLYYKMLLMPLSRDEVVEESEGIADSMLKRKDYLALSLNLEKFSGLSEEVALKLVEEGYWSRVFNNLGSFERLGDEVVRFLVEKVGIYKFIYELGNASGLSENVFRMVLKDCWDKDVLWKNLDAFDVNGDRLMEIVIEENYILGPIIIIILNKFDSFSIDTLSIILKEVTANIIFENFEKFNISQLDLFNMYVEADIAYFFRMDMDLIAPIQQGVALRMIELGRYDYVLDNLKLFEELDFEKLISGVRSFHYSGDVDRLLKASDQDLTRDSAIRILKEDFVNEFFGNLDRFEGVKIDSEIFNIILNGNRSFCLSDNMDKFEDLGESDAVKMIEYDRWHLVVDDIDSFGGVTTGIILALIKAGRSWNAADLLKENEGLWSKEVVLGFAEEGFSGGDYYNVIDDYLDRDLLLALAKGGNTNMIVKKWDVLKGYVKSLEDYKLMFDYGLKNSDMVFLKFLVSENPACKLVHYDIVLSVVGDFLSWDSYKLVEGIMEGTLSEEEMALVGIKEYGKVGINQLLQRLEKFREVILNGSEEIFEWFESGAFYGDYFKNFVRFKVGTFGSNSDRKFKELVESSRKYGESEECVSLDERYQEYALNIRKIGTKEDVDYVIPEDVMQKFNFLTENLRNALNMHLMDGFFRRFVDDVNETSVEVRRGIEEDLKGVENHYQRANLEKQLQGLVEVNYEDCDSFEFWQTNFGSLFLRKEFRGHLVALVFYYGLKGGAITEEQVMGVLGMSDGIDMEGLNNAIEIIDHMMQKTTWKEVMGGLKMFKKAKGVVNSNALNHALKEWRDATIGEEVEGRDFRKIDCIPTRGLLMEFSGYMADACWAGRFDSMAKTYPNVVSVSFVQNRGNKSERVAGASLLIETDSDRGEPLLVIRGLNPIENIINGLDVEDFLRNFFDYVAVLAEELGRTPAVVIDDRRGGSASNRSVVFNALKQRKGEMVKVVLASDEDSRVNGYNIVENVYRV